MCKTTYEWAKATERKAPHYENVPIKCGYWPKTMIGYYMGDDNWCVIDRDSNGQPDDTTVKSELVEWLAPTNGNSKTFTREDVLEYLRNYETVFESGNICSPEAILNRGLVGRLSKQSAPLQDVEELAEKMDALLFWAEENQWVRCDDGLWAKDGWKTRNTKELYQLYAQSLQHRGKDRVAGASGSD